MVHLNEDAGLVINLLIKSHCCLICVNLFHIVGLPAMAARNVEPVPPSTSEETLPVREFLFILLTRAHSILYPDQLGEGLVLEDTYSKIWLNCLFGSVEVLW